MNKELEKKRNLMCCEAYLIGGVKFKEGAEHGFNACYELMTNIKDGTVTITGEGAHQYLELKDKLDIAKEALEFYGSFYDEDNPGASLSKVHDDKGSRAREALEKLK